MMVQQYLRAPGGWRTTKPAETNRHGLAIGFEVLRGVLCYGKHKVHRLSLFFKPPSHIVYNTRCRGNKPPADKTVYVAFHINPLTEHTMDILKNLLDIIGNLPTTGAQAANIAFLKDKLDLVVADARKLEADNANLRERCAQLEQQLASQAKTAEYVEHRGALFKRKPGGGYMDAPTCPACHTAMGSLGDVLPFKCGDRRCLRQASFTGQDLPRIMAELAALGS